MGLIPGDRRVLLPVYLYTMGTWASYALVIVVLPFRFQDLGLSVVEYGIALAVYAFGTLATEGLWGYLAFRIGSVRWLGSLAVVTAVSLFALGFTSSFPLLVALLGIYGALVVYSTPLMRWIGMTASGPGTASRGIGLLGLFFGAGMTAGTAVGPVLYSLGGFWLNLYAGTALLLVSTIPLLLVRWDAVSLPQGRPRADRSLKALLERRFALATALVVLFFMVLTLETSFLQYYSIDLFGGTVEEAGYVIGAGRAVALVSGVVLGGFVDRWGHSRAAPLGFLLLAVGAVGTWASASYGEMVAATLVLACGVGWLSVSLLPMALSSILPEHQGTAVGVFGSFEDLGLILGPLVFGLVYANLGARDLFPVAAALALLGGILALSARARWRPQPSPVARPAPPVGQT